MDKGYDAFVVFDADNTLAPDYLARMNDAFAAGAMVCKSRTRAANPTAGAVAGCYGLYNACPCGQGGGFGVVGAVVGNDIHVPELLRVVLVQYAADEAADDGFLVPSGGQDGEAFRNPIIPKGPFQLIGARKIPAGIV